ncbi:DEP domain-containing protein 1A isoform X1 [Cynoglossus semilaevis]|uniref:DEP domain containing 1a n=1 Tax=Cynoglossus semilaevis TaxID=244447 RepID=A0A3P8UPJ5_CYNSE|nr:DEP domain-containing protein 1A isoform X1 [Cynoglossus semilaevis]
MSSHIITPGPYRATKLWNEVTRLFRTGMPLRKHRQNFRNYSSCFTSSAAVDWLHQLLVSNSNFGPDVTRQQTVQLLKKFLKNHVIEDVKGRWGTEDLDDNSSLYRFPSTSPLKPIPCPAKASTPGSLKKRPSFKDFRFRSAKKGEKETLENVDPALQAGAENGLLEEQQMPRRELTLDDEQEIWKDITLIHLQRILDLASLDGVLNQCHIKPQHIIHNMTKVNKHGVVTLEDKSNDLPHWVLSAMKSLANWTKYDGTQPAYPGFERDVFKTVSDYFYSLPEPLLTFELYELFINVLVLCGYVATPTTQQHGKRKKSDFPSVPPPAKASFRSTECLLLSLLRQGTCDETESPMRDVLGGKLQSRLVALKGGAARDAQFGGSLMSLNTGASVRPQTRSCSLETILDDGAPLSRQQLFLSTDSLVSFTTTNSSRTQEDGLPVTTPHIYSGSVTCGIAPVVRTRSSSTSGLLGSKRLCHLRPHSVGSFLDIVVECREEDVKETPLQGRATSCFNVNMPTTSHHSSSSGPSSVSSFPPSSSSSSFPHHPLFPLSPSAAAKALESHAATGAGGPRPTSSTSNLWAPSAPAVVRRCLSSMDVSKPPRPLSLFKRPVGVPSTSSSFRCLRQKPEHSVLHPQCERVAIEALQLCTLLLPPASRRKLQLLMRMMSRISQNVDMPRLHPAIGTRTLMVHTFSGCVLGSAEECDLDELLATRLVSFLMDHQQSILSVPQYLLSAISDHVLYLRTVQIPIDDASNLNREDPVCTPVPVFAFCRQISGAEFEQQKQASSQQAMEELLEILLTDQNISEKDRRKKLKLFQKQYPEIYHRRVPPTDRENKAEHKPKIKPALLTIKKTKAFSIRN